MENKMVDWEEIAFSINLPSNQHGKFILLIGTLNQTKTRLLLTVDQYNKLKSTHKQNPQLKTAYAVSGENPAPYINGINALDCRTINFDLK